MRGRREAMGQAGVVMMKKPVASCGTEGLREGTSGRVVSMLPRVWAVGEDGALRRCSERRGARVPEEWAGANPGPNIRTWGTHIYGRANPGPRFGTRGTRIYGEADPGAQSDDDAATEEVAFYRKYTEALLRRYQRLRMQAGRVPSPMDREVFRGKMSHYRVQGFDDAVIFCADVERCLGRLNAADQRLVRRVAVQEYTMGEAAGLLGMSMRSCIVLYRRALDRITRLFLEARILTPEDAVKRAKSVDAG